MDSDEGTIDSRLLLGSYRRPYRRSLTRDFLGWAFFEQARVAEEAGRAVGEAARRHEHEVEEEFLGHVSAPARRWPRGLAVLAAVGAAALWLLA